ncbi:M23 family metallopeptidase [Nocardioides sp.]|uniref:M23 family metallopeptidase n=1 Tax=Nocardioides sp. TaxID=35761 RepID=UPI0035688EDB
MTTPLPIAVAFVLAGLLAGFPASAETDPVGTWPLLPPPAVVRPFEPASGPYSAGHRGVDLAGDVGQPVRAALPGTITYAGLLAGRGVVVVAHGMTRTTYEPVEAAVSLGQEVAAGSVLGTLSQVASHCPPRPCLHWGWIAGETYLDPLRLVGTGSVRLLPLWSEVVQRTRGPAPALMPAPVIRLADALAGMRRAVGRW